MSRQGNRRKTSLKRKVEKTTVRKEDAKDGQRKMAAIVPPEVKKARERPLSVSSKKVLRELDTKVSGPKNFSEVITNKAKEKGLSVPTNPAEVKKVASTLRATPRPTEYWLSLQQ
jgi:hypothetical protein